MHPEKTGIYVKNILTKRCIKYETCVRFWCYKQIGRNTTGNRTYLVFFIAVTTLLSYHIHFHVFEFHALLFYLSTLVRFKSSNLYLDAQIVWNEFRYTKVINMVYSANYNFGIDEGKNRKNKISKALSVLKTIFLFEYFVFR